ncbi:hypothetical protein TNCV_1403491 [Trichonephila clavipes]|nr:hypothetical protein TNCV_1403491 [Trichonephila clavipes]
MHSPFERMVVIYEERQGHTTSPRMSNHYDNGGLIVRAGITLDGRTHLYVFARGTVTAVRFMDSCGSGLVSLDQMGISPTTTLTLPLRHGGTLNNRRAASPLVWLVEGVERWDAPGHPQVSSLKIGVETSQIVLSPPDRPSLVQMWKPQAKGAVHALVNGIYLNQHQRVRRSACVIECESIRCPQISRRIQRVPYSPVSPKWLPK